MADITVLGAVKGPSYPLLTPAETYFYLYAAASSFFVKMWPPNEFEFDTPVLDKYRK